MEILDMTFAGIKVWLWIVLAWLAYGGHSAWKAFQSDRQMKRELDEASSKFDAEHVWKPRMINGVDCGEWVRKDGRPFGIDD